jgi:biopolymer transport protein ExbB/TolQ
MNEIVNVFTSQEPSGLVVTWLIVAIFGIGVLDVLRSFIRLRRERKYVKTARAHLDSIVAGMQGEPLLSALAVPPETLLGKRIARVVQLRVAGLGYRDVLQKLTVEHVERYGATARFIGTILTMLGLVGTVVGMSFAMLRMSGVFEHVNDVKALARLTEALSGTLQGMQTAFACTLAGLASAVVMSYLNYALRRLQSDVVRQIEEFVTCELLTAFERVDPDADNAAKAFAQVLTAATDNLSALCTTLAEVSTRYADTGTEMMKSATTLGTAVQQLSAAASQLDTRVTALEGSAKANRALQDSIVTYNEQFKGFVEKNTSQLEEGLKRLLHEVNQHYRDGVKNHVDGTQARLAQIITDNNARFSDLMGQHSTKLQSFSDMMLEVYVNGRKVPVKESES